MDTKISQLPLVNSVSGNEDIPAVVNGQNVRIKSNALQTQTNGATTIAGITGLQAALDAKATPGDITAAVASKADTSALTAGLAGKATPADITAAVASKADTSALTSGLAGKAATAHSHAIADVTGLQTALDAKTDLTAVDARIQAVVGAAPEALDTLAEIASQLQDDSSAVAALTATVAGKADSVHSHAIAGVTGLQAALDAKATPADITAAVADKADTSALTSGLAGKAATVHSHAIADTTGLQAALDSKTDLAAVDARIQAVVGAAPEALDTLAEIASQLQDDSSAVAALTVTVAGKAASVHSHAIADVTGLQTALDTKADLIPMTAALADKADNAHIHAVADVTGLQDALDTKSDTEHAHAIADVTGLQASLNGKASSSHNHAYADISDLNALLAHIKRNTVWPILSAVVSNITATSVDVEVTINNTNGYFMGSVSIESSAEIGGTDMGTMTPEAFVGGVGVYNYTITGLVAATEYSIVTFLSDLNNQDLDKIADVTSVVTTLAA